MDVDDWKFLLAGSALQLGPFLAFTLWTFVPLSDRRVAEWFAGFGRLHPSGVPLVRDRLVRVRWHRRIGGLLGAVTMWAVMSWYGIVHSDGGPSGVAWSPLFGYVAGAVLAEFRSVRTPTGDRRSAELSPRRITDYLAPWVLPTVTVITSTAVGLTLASPLLAPITAGEPDPGMVDPALRSLLIVSASGLSLWCARRVARLPLRQDPRIDPYLDDAFRQMSIVTCLAGGCLIAVASSGVWEVTFRMSSWWLLAWALVGVPLCLVAFVALRQPVPWTFGPRIRSAWTAAPGPSEVSLSRP